MTEEHSRLDVSLVVVAYNSSGVLPGLLESLPEAAGPLVVQVTVVDNASQDASRTRRIAEEHGAAFIGLETNLGYGGGANAGVRSLSSPGRRVLVCNADLVFRPGAIERLVSTAERHTGAGALGPRILNRDGSIYPSARRSPSLVDGVGHALLGRVAPQNPWSVRYRGPAAASTGPRPTDWLSGACLLLETSLFLELGGFDESYFMYFEDVDLGDRVRAAGLVNLYVPESEILHIGGHSTAQTSARMIRIHHESAYRYLSRKYRGPWLAPVRAAIRAGLALRLRFETRTGSGPATRETNIDPSD